MRLKQPDFHVMGQAPLEKAARRTRERIQDDLDRATAKLKPLLEHIATHLFDPDLNVNQLKRACGIGDNSIVLDFHAEIGTPPKTYISRGRLEAAAELLRDTDLRIWQIAELVGYSGISVFSKAFERWAGQRPKLYRREARQRHGSLSTSREPELSDEVLRRALAGALPIADACPILARLVAHYGWPSP